MSLITVPCAVCDGTRFIPVYPSTIRDTADQPASYYSSSRARVGHLDIVRCAGCGLLMTNPRDDDQTLACVYRTLRDATYDGEDRARRRTGRALLTLVERYQAPRRRLLDVGCGTGWFVGVAADAGWTATGLEVSRWAVGQARQRCPGATILSGRLEDADLPRASFDVVTLWNVLEHMSSPGEALARVRAWLAPTGHLFLALPNADSFTARRMGHAWVLLLREHLWYFDPSTIARLLRRWGFEPVETRPISAHFSIAGVLDRVAKYPDLVGCIARCLAGVPVARDLPVRWRIGEMCVVARPASASWRDR